MTGERDPGGDRAQSNVLAVVLLVGLTVLGLGIVVGVGSDSLQESRSSATGERAELALTGFDARSAAVALGDRPGDRIDLGDVGGGQFEVEPEAGWIRVVHTNYSGETGESERVFEATMGLLRYEHDDVVLGYQAGGVWRAQRDGSVMVTPPDLLYHDETLTLPLVRVKGAGHASGPVRSVVTADAATAQHYPDASDSYGDGTRTYRNPVENGTVTVTVHSTFYRAWADYFRTRTEGAVEVFDENRTVRLELVAGGTSGDFQMPREGNAVEVRGLSRNHGVRNFTVVLTPDNSDSANFDNLQWTMYADTGTHEFELHLRKTGELQTERACNDEVVGLSLYYSGVNGDPYQGWRNDTAFRTTCTDFDGDGLADETQLVANLTGPSVAKMGALDRNDLIHFNPSGATVRDEVSFDEHEAAVDWEPISFDLDGDRRTTYRRVTRHYLSMLGSNYDLVVDDKESDTVQESESWGTLAYESRGRVTFMHITEHVLSVDLEG